MTRKLFAGMASALCFACFMIFGTVGAETLKTMLFGRNKDDDRAAYRLNVD